MEYLIKGFDGYAITDDCKIIKRRQCAGGEKVSEKKTFRNKGANHDYVRLTKVEGGKSRSVVIALDEVYCCAKLGIEPGTPEAKKELKKFRYERGLMGQVKNAVGDYVEEQELVNQLHADLVRQMKSIGLNVDVDNLTVFTVAQLLFDYLRICKECSGKPYTLEVDTRTGTATITNPLWEQKYKIYDRVVTGLRALGLTFERVAKQLPTDVLQNVSADMFEQKEREDATVASGITWVE